MGVTHQETEIIMAILTKGKSLAASHWYTPDGQPAHEQFRKDDSGTRPTTIRDAKALRLLPSVTSILGVFAKPGLETWKIKQAVAAAHEHPRQQAESLEYWTQRVMDAAFAQVEAAADLGSGIHNALDLALGGETFDAQYEVYVRPVLDWLTKTGIIFTAREIVLLNHAEGYAGRVDALFSFGKAGIGIIDWKTRKTKPGEKVTPYEGQGLQLAAYAAAHYGADALPRVLAANIYISSTEPGRMEVCKHDTLPELYDAFLHACAIWRYLKGYDPRPSPQARQSP
jgi:hypothetical protein